MPLSKSAPDRPLNLSTVDLCEPMSVGSVTFFFAPNDLKIVDYFAVIGDHIWPNFFTRHFALCGCEFSQVDLGHIPLCRGFYERIRPAWSPY